MIEFRGWIEREDVIREPKTLFVFGDNFARFGFGGQAREIRGEPNSVGIPTKRLPSMRPEAFLSDADLDEWRERSAAALQRLTSHAGRVVWPRAGIGGGRARLEDHAPLIRAEIDSFLARLVELHRGS